jgi:hypothetical protein
MIIRPNLEKTEEIVFRRPNSKIDILIAIIPPIKVSPITILRKYRDTLESIKNIDIFLSSDVTLSEI